jgi:hypothetical protein
MFYLGLDLGKQRDYTAVAILEKPEWRHAWLPVPKGCDLMVRHLERMPPGTRYPAVVERVREIVRSEELRGQCIVVADATGIGGPVLDMLRRAALGCEVTAVTITGGAKERAARSSGAPASNVTKQDLIAGLQLMLEGRELKIAARLKEAGTLVKELMDMRFSGVERGKMKVGADGSGEHDDLVIAVALAVWRARRGRDIVEFGTRRLF